VVLAIDQSGSMASSVVYASVFGAVLASMRSLKTALVVFDTAVVDLTERGPVQLEHQAPRPRPAVAKHTVQLGADLVVTAQEADAEPDGETVPLLVGGHS